MSLSVGTRIANYEVLGSLGAGGMGQVFRARDTKLGREVAVKVLLESVAADPERIARFEREAKALAALNHPHIATLFGMEHADNRHLLVMELVEGPTLQEHIRSAGAAGATAVDRSARIEEAVAIAIQIAEALEAAHERGIVHRDLKPANIKVSGDPLSVKVLDFGLAKALDPADGRRQTADGAGFTNSPTLSVMATGAGMILGTAAYMSPEQAKGQPADHRSDIFSFGCVLFEMLTGRMTFEGDSVSDVLAAVIKSEPDWSRLPANISPRFLELLQRCLAKSRRDRYQAIGDVRIELNAIQQTPFVAPAAMVASAASRRSPLTWAVGLLLASMAGAAVASAVFIGRSREVPALPMRFVVPLRDGEVFTGPARRTVGISPDGTEIAYAVDQRLHVRRFGDLEQRAVTDGQSAPSAPSYSPDGKSIAFYDSVSEELKRVTTGGGVATTLAKIGRSPYDLVWSAEGLHYTSDEGVFRVRDSGGTPELVAKSEPNEAFGSVDLIPGGTLLVSSIDMKLRGDNATTGFDRARLLAIQPDGQRRVLIEGGTSARYLASGHLVFVRQGVVLAVGFDATRLSALGGPIPVVEGVGRGQAIGQFSVSATGSLVYIPGPTTGASGPWRPGVFSSAQPEGSSLKVTPGPFVQARLSPNGRLLALSMDNDSESAIWLYDMNGSESLRRLTLGAAARFPVWSADSQRVIYQRRGDTSDGMFWQRADGSDTPEALTRPGPGTFQLPASVSPNGEHLLFDEWTDKGVTVWSYSFRDRKPTPIAGFESSLPTGAAFSPDGRWIAAAVRRSGTRSIVFVQPFPPTGALHQISKDGVEDGHHPAWARDGASLIYNPGPGSALKVAPVRTRPAFSFTEPRDILVRFRREAPSAPRSFDVAPDGRFVGFSGPAGNDTAASHLVVVLNWIEELKQRVPIAR